MMEVVIDFCHCGGLGIGLLYAVMVYFICFETCPAQLRQWLQGCPQFQTSEVPSTRRLGSVFYFKLNFLIIIRRRVVLADTKSETELGPSFSSGVQINSVEYKILKALMRRH